MAATVPQRRPKLMGRRRHVDDEADERAIGTEDDSVTEGSVASDDHGIDGDDHDNDSSNIDEASSPTTPIARKPHVATTIPTLAAAKSLDTALMLHEISEISVEVNGQMVDEINYNEVAAVTTETTASHLRTGSIVMAPVIVSSDMGRPSQSPGDKRRREDEEYRKRIVEDPSLVPTRGLFFMHDQRHSGLPVGGSVRGPGRAGREGLLGSSGLLPIRIQNDRTISDTWAHDLHESVAEPPLKRYPHHGATVRHLPRPPAQSTGNSAARTCPPSDRPIDRHMSIEKTLGKVSIRVWLPAVGMEKAVIFPGVIVNQYTKLPDHRPPLRRDKAVRISLPFAVIRFILPAEDRSFVFIPRAMRPNQHQRVRGKPPSRLGSMGGWSRRTSVFGGSFYESAYSASAAAMSRRSSVALDPRDLFPPANSAASRIPMGNNGSVGAKPVPVVRLPPSSQQHGPDSSPSALNPNANNGPPPSQPQHPQQVPQQHPQSSKHTPQGIVQTALPMRQPQPQMMAVTTGGIEPSPSMAPHDGTGATNSSVTREAFQQAFHQQVPVSVSSAANGHPPDGIHARHPSFAASSHGRLPLSQIPERAIHAAPFQPNAEPTTFDQGYQYPHPHPHPHLYSMMQQNQPQPPPPPGYYYASTTPYSDSAPSAAAPAFTPGMHQAHGLQPAILPYGAISAQPAGSSHIQQEHNGMVYYFDVPHLTTIQQPPPINAYPPPYGPPPHGYVAIPIQVGHPPDSFYYPPHTTPQGMTFYA